MDFEKINCLNSWNIVSKETTQGGVRRLKGLFERTLKGMVLSICLMLSLLPSLFAFEIKVDYEVFLDTPLSIVYEEDVSSNETSFPTTAKFPLGFNQGVGLNILFDEQNLLTLAWELAYTSQGHLQFMSPDRWKKTWTSDYLGENELENKLILDYIAQPLLRAWVRPYAEYHTKLISYDIGDADLTYRDNFFAYNGYRGGLELGYNEIDDYFVRFRDDDPIGWTASAAFSYGGKVFNSKDSPFLVANPFELTNLIIPSNSTLGNTVDLIVPLNDANVKESLNYSDFRTDFKTSFKQKNMLFELGYTYEIDFIPNQFILTDDFTLTKKSAIASFQTLFLGYKILFGERQTSRFQEVIRDGSNYLLSFKVEYFFEADFYDDQALRLVYGNPTSLIDSVHLLGEFDTDTRTNNNLGPLNDIFIQERFVGLYLQNDDEKLLNHITLETRLNYLPKRGLAFYYSFTAVNYKNFVLPAERSISSSEGELRGDGIHNLRITFDFFRYLDGPLYKLYAGYTIVGSNDTEVGLYRSIITAGFTLSYKI